VWLLPLPYLFGVVVTSAFALIALGRAVVAPELDLGLLVLVSVTTLVSTGFVLDGLRRGRGYSLWRGMRGALSALLLQVPALTAVGCVVASAKSVRFTDIVEAQGAWPWQWYAFESVGLLLAFGLLL